jgi:hypothetical protein
MNGPVNYGDSDEPRDDTSTGALGADGIDDAVLDLVLAASEEGTDGLTRVLLRSLVALGLTRAASAWLPEESAADPWEPTWVQYRGFGGPTSAPTLPVHPAQNDEACGRIYGASLSFRYGQRGAIVVMREAFDADGGREEREDQVESLIQLAGTLRLESHDYPSFPIGETEGKHGSPGPLPTDVPDQENGRQAG